MARKYTTQIEHPEIVIRETVLKVHLKEVAKSTIDIGSYLRNFLSGLLLVGLCIKSFIGWISSLAIRAPATKPMIDWGEFSLFILCGAAGVSILWVLSHNFFHAFNSPYRTTDKALEEIKKHCEATRDSVRQ